MANDNSLEPNQMNSPSSSLSTQQLRALAQSHLVEIEEDIVLESQQQIIAKQDLEKYTKSRRKGRSHSPLDQPSAPDTDATKGPKFRSAQDVLGRLQWDPSIHIHEYVIGYLERFEGLKEMPVSNWVRETTDEDFIPQHRIKYVKKRMPNGGEEMVWNRDERVDKLFGSGRADPMRPDDKDVAFA